MHEVVGARMLREVRDHRPHDRQVVHACADVRKQVTDGNAALAVVAELPGTLEHIAHVVELGGVGLDLDRLAVFAIEPGLGVERIELGRTAVHEQEDDARALRPGNAAAWERAGFPACAAGRARAAWSDRASPKAGSRRSTDAASAAEAGAASQEHVAAAGARCEKSLAVHLRPHESPACEPDRRSKSINEDKFFHIDQHMAEIGPGLERGLGESSRQQWIDPGCSRSGSRGWRGLL